VILGGTGFAVRAADAHNGGIHKRRHLKASFGFATWRDGRVGFAAVALGPESPAGGPAFILLAEAAKSCGAPGRGAGAPGTGAFHGGLRAGGHGVTFRGRGGEIVAGYFPMPRDFS